MKAKKSKEDRISAVKAKAAKEQANKATTGRRRTKFDFDLWGADAAGTDASPPEQEAVLKSEWLEDNTKIHNKKNTGRLKGKLPSDAHDKTSSLSAVAEPEAGSSYNPSYKDHQDLLRRAWVAEVNKERAQHRVDFHTTMMFPRAGEAPTEKTYLEEMSEGIKAKMGQEEEEEEADEEEGSGSEEEEEDEAEKDSSHKLKTRKQRRKAREQAAERKRAATAKNTKRVNTDIFRIRSLKREIAASEKKTAERKLKRALLAEAKRAAPARLSANKFAEPDLDLKLTEELTGNLRSLKPEGSILQDRYKSLQRRNIVETTVRTKAVRNKHKRKKVEKRSYKMPWEKVQ